MLQYRGRRIVLAVAAVLALGVGSMAGEHVSPNAEGFYSMIGPGSERLANSMTGELYADLMGSTVTAQRIFKDALPSIADYCQSAHLVANSYCGPDNKWVMWDTPYLSRDVRDRNDGYLGYKQTVSGFATGISRMLGEATAIGLAVGYDARKLTGQDNYHWRNKADTFHAAIYGGTALGCFFIDGYAGYSRAWQRTERNVEFDPVYPNTAKGNFNDTVLSAGLKASYVWILPNDMRITPSIGADFSHVRTGAFREKSYYMGIRDDFAALAVDKNRHSSLQTPIMVSVNKTFSANFLTFGGTCSLWTPEIRAGYVPQFGAKRASADYSFIDPAMSTLGSFTAKSTKLGGSYGTVGAGLKIKLKDKFIFAVDYDYTFGQKYDKHVVTGTYGVSF
jgi:outer membrane autotransporter protein